MSCAAVACEKPVVHWVGVDVAKATFDAGFVLAGQHWPQTPLRDVAARSFPRSRDGVRACLKWLDEELSEADHAGTARFVMEATGNYSVELAVWLLEARPSTQPAIANPQQTAAFIKSFGLRNKTDRLEARALAFYGAERRPAGYEPPTPERAELRSLSRYRDGLVEEKVAEGNRAEEGASSALVRKMQKRRVAQLTRDIARVEADMKRLVKQTPPLKKDIDQLMTIYGVGFITAVVIVAELGDLRRFERARQLTAFAGVSPREFRSGTSVNGGTHMCKRGNPRVRQALYMAALTAIGGRNEMALTYVRLVDEGKAKKAALGAVMRKLLTIMRAVLIYEQPYNPWHNTGGKPCKMPI